MVIDMRESERFYCLIFALAFLLSWSAVFPRMGLVEGVFRVVDAQGRTISENGLYEGTVSENEGILDCESDRMKIHFWFQDLNN